MGGDEPTHVGRCADEGSCRVWVEHDVVSPAWCAASEIAQPGGGWWLVKARAHHAQWPEDVPLCVLGECFAGARFDEITGQRDSRVRVADLGSRRPCA